MNGYGLMNVGNNFLDFLFPIHCVGCGGNGAVLCPRCQGKLNRLEPPYCRICASDTDGPSLCEDCALDPLPIDGIRAPHLMDDPIRGAIHKLKYNGLRAAAPTLGGLFGDWFKGGRIPGDHLVPVPLHHRRMSSRGYNQSALLAKYVSEISGLPVDDVLKRTRDTSPQASSGGRHEREQNVHQSFVCKEEVRGCKIILVDDVVTSGSTMAACAQALKASGAASIWGIALARQATSSHR